MRLMDAGAAGGSRLVCLYCGIEAESRPPYAVMYCDCRSERFERRDGGTGGTPPNAIPAR